VFFSTRSNNDTKTAHRLCSSPIAMNSAWLVLSLLCHQVFARTAHKFLSLTQAGSRTSVSVGLRKKRISSAIKGRNGLENAHKLAYFGQLAVGTPSQTFSVVFDTGSGNLIVPGIGCTSAACKNHRQFDKSKSSSTRLINCDGSEVGAGYDPDEITITFGTGHITGSCLQDRICLGDACTVGVFIASTDESPQPFSYFSFDGVLGLALDSMAQSKQFSMMSRLSESGQLQQPLFSVFLSDSDNEESEITFGEVKKEHMGSELFWVKVSGNSGYWEVHIDDITLNGKKQSLCQHCRVAVDTGTSELAGPSDIIAKLHSLLDVQSDCQNYDSLPDLGFVIGGRILTLTPRDYVDNKQGSSCDVSLMSLDVPPPKGPLFVFGIPFLTKYFTVYDHEKSMVGFAVAKHFGKTPESLVAVNTLYEEQVVESEEVTTTQASFFSSMFR